MARTRGTSNVEHDDDGVLVDKEGKPIPTGSTSIWAPAVVKRDMETLAARFAEPVVKPPPVEVEKPRPAVYRCNGYTIGRNIDAIDMFHLLEMMLSERLALELDEEKFGLLHANLKQHFRKV